MPALSNLVFRISNPGLRSFLACPGLCCIAPSGHAPPRALKLALIVWLCCMVPSGHAPRQAVKLALIVWLCCIASSGRAPWHELMSCLRRLLSQLIPAQERRRTILTCIRPNGAKQQSPGQATKERRPGSASPEEQALKGRGNRRSTEHERSVPHISLVVFDAIQFQQSPELILKCAHLMMLRLIQNVARHVFHM